MRAWLLFVLCLLGLLPSLLLARRPDASRFFSFDGVRNAVPEGVAIINSATNAPSPLTALTSSPATPSPPSPPSPPIVPSGALLSPAADTWAVRLTPTAFLLTENATLTGVVTKKSWPIAEVNAKLTAVLGSHDADRQQRRLQRYVEKVERRLTYSASANASWSQKEHKGEHKGWGHHGSKHYSELPSFYLRHAQCRACVGGNLALLSATTTSAVRSAVPSYAPLAVMKWCSLQQPLLPHEAAPSAQNPAPLQDWEGVCVPATVQCPSTTVDLNVLSPTTCANDVAVTKQSCALCVMDGYEWRTHKRAVKGGDNYDGQCASSGVGRSTSPWAVTMTQLDECPSVMLSEKVSLRMQQVKGGMFLFVSFAAGLCCCLALRRCCQVSKARKAARLAALAAHVQSAVPVAEPVHVVSSQASQPSSSSVYPAHAAVSQQRPVAPMQEPLLVSSGLNPPFYPQLSSNPPPYAYGYRM